MLTMVHYNPASIADGRLRIDRKFYLGMLEYAAKLPAPLVSVHPAAAGALQGMDVIELPLDGLPFAAMTLDVDGSMMPTPADHARLRDQVARSTLVYGGGLGAAELARGLNVPYLLVLELDLATSIRVATVAMKNPVRKAAWAAKWLKRHYGTHRRNVRGARRIHCNGYPVYDEARRINPECLLYLDSRMSTSMVIPDEALEGRLAGRAGRPLRLLFSGRYEPIKGCVDAVRVGAGCLEAGLDVEMHCYGQGSQRDEMRRVAAGSGRPGRIQVHDALPYPELVELSRTFDLFVCCHVQGDPSCTYLETLGAGLPIVGYDNRMWRRLSGESRAGFHSPMHRPARVVEDIKRLAADPELLADLSRNAAGFARDHAFEREFARRIEDLSAALARAATPRPQPAPTTA